MEFNWKNYILDLASIDKNKFLNDWKWLIGPKKELHYISNTGSFFFSDIFGHLYIVNSAFGLPERIADNIDEFQMELQDEEDLEEWFKPHLVKKLILSDFRLLKNQLYGPKASLISEYEELIENYEIRDIVQHFELNSKILKELRGW